jgi:hypothetical protein
MENFEKILNKNWPLENCGITSAIEFGLLGDANFS